MGVGNLTISGETETKVWAACHSVSLGSLTLRYLDVHVIEKKLQDKRLILDELTSCLFCYELVGIIVLDTSTC